MQHSGFALCLLLALGTGASHAQTLNLLTWEAYFSDEAIAQWEAQSGVHINQIFFDKDEVRNTILFSSESTRIDLVVLDPTTASVIGERDFFVPLSQYRNTPNLVNADPVWAQRCGNFSVPYMWGSLGLVYRRDKVIPAPHSWNDLMHPKPAMQGHIGLVENYVDTLAPAMILRNAPVTTDDELILREVFEQMQTLIPWVLTFDYAISFLSNSPDADQLYLALAYSGDQKQLNALSGTDNWAYVIPDEGSMLWGECLAILAQSSNKSLAMDFINFMNIPEVAARNSEILGITTANKAALPLLSEELRADPNLFPQGEYLHRLQHYDLNISIKNIMLRDRITSTLVELHDSQ